MAYDEDIDRLFRDKLQDCTVDVGEDLWKNIDRNLDGGIARRSRGRVVRWALAACCSAAACLAAALLLFKGDGGKSPENGLTVIADNSTGKQSESSRSDSSSSDFSSAFEAVIALEESARENSRTDVREDVRFAAGKSTRNTVKNTDLTESGTTGDKSGVSALADALADASSSYTKPSDAAASSTGAGTSSSGTSADATSTVAGVTSTDITDATDSKENDSSWWEESEDNRRKSSRYGRKGVSVSINSKVSAIGSENGFVADFGPSHASSQTGKSATASSVERTSDARFSVPLSFGARAKIHLTGNLHAGVGVRYTYLESGYDALINKQQFNNTSSQLHYIGIPVSLDYDFVNTGRFGAYVSVGAMADKCVKSRYVYGSNTLSEKVSGLQWSASLSVGAEYWFIDRLGIYLDPGLAYFFDNSQPMSIRTQQPLQINFEAGFRFKL